jgi:hypothetical protein
VLLLAAYAVYGVQQAFEFRLWWVALVPVASAAGALARHPDRLSLRAAAAGPTGQPARAAKPRKINGIRRAERSVFIIEDPKRCTGSTTRAKSI